MKVNDKVIKLQIWDTCGQEIYKSLISNFYRNSSLAVLVYAIDNKESLFSRGDALPAFRHGILGPPEDFRSPDSVHCGAGTESVVQSRLRPCSFYWKNLTENRKLGAENIFP